MRNQQLHRARTARACPRASTACYRITISPGHGPASQQRRSPAASTDAVIAPSLLLDRGRGRGQRRTSVNRKHPLADGTVTSRTNGNALTKLTA